MALDVLVQRGIDRMDCVHKIVRKYGVNFTILRERNISGRGGLFGLFPRDRVEVEFYLSSQLQVRPPQPQAMSQGQLMQQNGTYGRSGQNESPASAGEDNTLDFLESRKKVIAASGRDPEKIIRDIRKSEEDADDRQAILAQLKELGETNKLLLARAERKKEHPMIDKIAEMLKANDFSDNYIRGILDRIRREVPLQELEDLDGLQDRVLQWIGESISFFPITERPPRKAGEGHAARIVVLVGPTGVGKTTTVAKLAAIYGVGGISGQPPLLVRLITIDMFRIGAQHQLEIYGNVMEIPVSFIGNHHELQREIDLHREVADIILVDTIGRSPRDAGKLAEMQQILDACGPKAEVHLTVSAGTKTEDLLLIMRQFEPFDYAAVLLTKFDETRNIGNVISALAERGKPVSYVADGQTVPRDIRKADAMQFLCGLQEFRVDREEFSKRFPSGESDQFEMELKDYGRPG